MKKYSLLAACSAFWITTVFSPFSASVYNEWQSLSMRSFNDKVTLSATFAADFCLDFPAISATFTIHTSTLIFVRLNRNFRLGKMQTKYKTENYSAVSKEEYRFVTWSLMERKPKIIERAKLETSERPRYRHKRYDQTISRYDIVAILLDGWQCKSA